MKLAFSLWVCGCRAILVQEVWAGAQTRAVLPGSSRSLVPMLRRLAVLQVAAPMSHTLRGKERPTGAQRLFLTASRTADAADVVVQRCRWDIVPHYCQARWTSSYNSL